MTIFQQPVASTSNTGKEDSNPSFDLKNARYEVRKLGIEGFHGDEKQKAMTAFLMRLGAKVGFSHYIMALS